MTIQITRGGFVFRYQCQYKGEYQFGLFELIKSVETSLIWFNKKILCSHFVFGFDLIMKFPPCFHFIPVFSNICIENTVCIINSENKHTVQIFENKKPVCCLAIHGQYRSLSNSQHCSVAKFAQPAIFHGLCLTILQEILKLRVTETNLLILCKTMLFFRNYFSCI